MRNVNLEAYIREWAGMILRESEEERGYLSFEDIITDERTYKVVMKRVAVSMDRIYSLYNDSGEEVVQIRRTDFVPQDFQDFDGYYLRMHIDVRNVMTNTWYNESSDIGESNRPGPVRDREFNVGERRRGESERFTRETGLSVTTDETDGTSIKFVLSIADYDRFRTWIYGIS